MSCFNSTIHGSFWKPAFKSCNRACTKLKDASTRVNHNKPLLILKRQAWRLLSSVSLLVSFGGVSFGDVEAAEASDKEEVGKSIMITVVYDNYQVDDRLETAWGFSCVIQGLEKTILFDTGEDGDILLSNMLLMKIDPGDIDSIVISHIHHDHTGGLRDFLARNSDVDVYVPRQFPERLKDAVKQSGANLHECDKPQAVCEKAWTTGVLSNGIDEHGLYIATREGLLVITGCAHPGIVRIANAAKERLEKPIFAVMGGFHLSSASGREILSVIQGLKKLGVEKVAPSHCSGDRTRAMMKEEFGDGYLPSGAGARLAFQMK